MRTFTILLLAIFLFPVTLLAAPPNDDPAGAVSLVPSTAFCTNQVAATTIAATATTTPSSTAIDDVWFKLDNANAGNVTITLNNVYFDNPVGGDIIVIKLWMYISSSNTWTGYAPSTNGIYNTGNITASTPAVQFYVQIYTASGATTRANFNLCARYSDATAANDNCTSPLSITSQAGNCATTTKVTTLGSTVSTQPFKKGSNNNDTWYSFTAQSAFSLIKTSNIVYSNDFTYPANNDGSLYLEVAQNNCGTYTLIDSGLAGGTITLNNLTAGTTYLIRAYVAGVPAGGARFAEFDICVSHYSVPANNEAATATAFTAAVGNCFIPANAVSGTTMGATTSSQARCAGGTHYDVWYSITPTTNNVKIQFNPSDETRIPIIELWNSAATTRIACTSGTTLSSAVTASTNYKVRVASYAGTYSNFTFNALSSDAPPVNDECNNATVLSQNTDANLVAATGTTIGASMNNSISYGLTCSGDNSGGDVWYTFTAIKNQIIIELRNVTGNTPMTMQLFSDCTSTSQMFTNCTGLAVATVVPGNTYYLRVLRVNGCDGVNFNVHTKVPESPINDECNRAFTLSPQLIGCSSSINYISAATTDATQSTDALNATCSPENNDDVWFKFSTGSTNFRYALKLRDLVQNTFPAYGVLTYELYSGTCASKTYIGCGQIASNSFTNEDNRISVLPALSTNTTYFIRLYTNDQATEFAFKAALLQLSEATNITCATAQSITAGSGSAMPVVLSGNTLAPQDETSCTPPNLSVRGVWYSFTATASSHLIQLSNIRPLSIDGAFAEMEVFSGSCGTLTSLSCFGMAGFEGGNISGLTVGQTYYICVKDVSQNSGPISFCIGISGQTCGNDEPATAFTLIQDVVCNPTTGNTSYSTITASPAQTVAAPDIAQGDVWYKFVASTSSAELNFNTPYNGFILAVYNNSMGRVAFTSFTDTIAISGTTFINYFNTTAGQSYYIRVTSFHSGAPNPPGAGQAFDLCVKGVPSTVLASDPAAAVACRTGDGPVVSTNSGRWLHLTDGGNMVASILDVPGGAGMGTINAQYYTHTGATRIIDGAYYADRNYSITPATQPTNPVRVKLYIKKTELNNLITASSATAWPITSLSDLKIQKINSNPCNTIITRGGSFFPVLAWGELDADNFFIEIEISSFSSFFMAPQVPSILPISLSSFTVKINQLDAELNWQAETEAAGDQYVVERSTDGVHFTAITTIQARNTGNSTRYGFTDVQAGKLSGKLYYRIRLVNKGGQPEYTAIRTAAFAKEGVKVNVLPNPGNGLYTLINQSTDIIRAEVYNAVGAKMQQVVIPASGTIQLDLTKESKGTYLLRLQNGETMWLIKQ